MKRIHLHGEVRIIKLKLKHTQQKMLTIQVRLQSNICVISWSGSVLSEYLMHIYIYISCTCIMYD